MNKKRILGAISLVLDSLMTYYYVSSIHIAWSIVPTTTILAFFGLWHFWTRTIEYLVEG